MLILLTAFSLTAYGKNNLTYCYENQPVLPHFYGSGANVPAENPGPAIEILQHLERLTPDLTIHYVRFPWKRCLNDLSLGKVDAVIGRYHPLREQIAKYPKTQYGNLDDDRSFSISSSCLVYKSNDIVWDGTNLVFEKPVSMSVPNGYGVISDMRLKGFDIYQAPSIAKAHELLFKGRVNVSLSNCQMDSLPEGFVENEIPINESIGYLIFSHQFYARRPELAHSLWDNLSKINSLEYYDKYFDKALSGQTFKVPTKPENK